VVINPVLTKTFCWFDVILTTTVCSAAPDVNLPSSLNGDGVSAIDWLKNKF
jgi:hypothetical protein